MRKLYGFFLILSASIFSLSSFASSIDTSSSNHSFFAIASAMAIGLAAFGGALAQGKAASAALSGIARNPGAYGKIFVPMILCMALIESLVLFALLISFIFIGKIN
jgi:F-type H+-transporting ATPase subunit c